MIPDAYLVRKTDKSIIYQVLTVKHIGIALSEASIIAITHLHLCFRLLITHGEGKRKLKMLDIG